ncbi:LysR family transcriptional regulator [Xaviernesmea oryzae]|uniref:HTH-type transcriptional regulator TtuA n=1 Tax=Xaviernesmea oryzae TaxID=464029 RepID=A0A1Q9ATL6_9HYPH|nr:LysR family transcriptional regulator [Xaviernesmea oryzae]OLP58756.1 LysR family transcriptional regulator [Xaviernesmea oryzae]SEM21566.1 DNA-binding transcriptional regulator, LysR family [Xaviernesmea oryzae]
MRDLNDIAYFAAVARHQGFSAAARALNVPKSLLSKHIAALEQELGVRLLERSTRMLRVTEVGQRFLDHCEQALANVETAQAVAVAAQLEPQGTVRLACPLGFAPMIAHVMPDFSRRYPKVQVLISVSNRRVDLVAEQMDIALRARPEIEMDETLVVRRLSVARRRLAASPQLLERLGAITIDSLHKQPTLSMNSEHGTDRWTLVNEAGDTKDVDHRPVIGCDDFTVLERAAIEGLGIALLPDHMCQRIMRVGLLAPVLPTWSAAEAIAHLVFTTRQGMLPAVRSLIDHLATQLPRVMARCSEVEVAPRLHEAAE